MPPGAKVLGRQNGACKNFTTTVKNRLQARLHRRQTLSDSNRLVRTVGEGGANGSGVARRGQVGAPAPGRTKKFFLYSFFDIFPQILKLLRGLLYCNVCCSQRIQITPYFRPHITHQRGARNSDFIHSSFGVICLKTIYLLQCT